uniref:Uncharacterized protein n=1 Tax=Glycine max TaxID=3847 RepID=C6T9U5_SOYBN|nr:unknown [Glycine max]
MIDISTLNAAQITVLGSAFCVMLSMHFTTQLMSQHLFYWKNPKEQKAIIIIILMAPIYAAVSFVGLLDIRGSKEFFTILESVKECYEALVIAKFLALMYSYLNISISRNIVPDEIKGREIHHSFPMTLFQPCTVRLNHHNLKLLKYWTWQFVVVRPVCSFSDDCITATRAVSNLVELGIHHCSQHICVVSLVFSGGLLPCVC